MYVRTYVCIVSVTLIFPEKGVNVKTFDCSGVHFTGATNLSVGLHCCLCKN